MAHKKEKEEKKEHKKALKPLMSHLKKDEKALVKKKK